MAPSIQSLDNLRPLTHIPYWNNFAPWLLSAVKATVIKLNLGPPATQTTGEESINIAEGRGRGHEQRAGGSSRSRTDPRKDMHHTEMLIEFTV